MEYNIFKKKSILFNKLNKKLKITKKKNMLGVLYHLQKKIEKKLEFADFWSDPDPELNPDKMSRKRIRIKINRIQNTSCILINSDPV